MSSTNYANSARDPRTPATLSSSIIRVISILIRSVQSNDQLCSAWASSVSQMAKPPVPSTLWYRESIAIPSGGMPPVSINLLMVVFRISGQWVQASLKSIKIAFYCMYFDRSKRHFTMNALKKSPCAKIFHVDTESIPCRYREW